MCLRNAFFILKKRGRDGGDGRKKGRERAVDILRKRVEVVEDEME